jgi:hypothetical protein
VANYIILKMLLIKCLPKIHPYSMERFFTITMNGRPIQVPVAGTTITTAATPTPRTWVKLSALGRITDAFIIDQTYEEAVRRRDEARKAVLSAVNTPIQNDSIHKQLCLR